MRKKVIDQNYLRGSSNRDTLLAFLNGGNVVLLSDYTALESTQGDAKINLRRSIETIRTFSDQVQILKDTRLLVTTTNSVSVSPDDLIDHEASTRVNDIFNAIEKNDQQLEKNAAIANTWFSDRKADAELEISGLREYQARYSKDELNAIRSWQTAPTVLKEKIVRFAAEDGMRLWKSHGYEQATGENEIRANSLVFRFCLAGNLLRLKWIDDAKFDPVHAKKVASDLTDATYYVLGTYFNGCLTEDGLSKEVLMKMIDCLRICYDSQNFMGKDF